MTDVLGILAEWKTETTYHDETSIILPVCFAQTRHRFVQIPFPSEKRR